MPENLQATRLHARWEFLDAIRGIAAVLVLMQHGLRGGFLGISLGRADISALALPES